MQALTSQQRYLPFGEERAIPNSPILATDFGYTGQRLLDSGMGGIMDYKARFYSPVLGRFLQPDTLIPGATDPQVWNRYSYTYNNPVRYNDPTGHCPWCVALAVVGAVAGATLFLISESQQEDGIGWEDVGDLAVATGTGLVAGALIGTGVGAAPGIAMFGGVGMGSALAVDHISNIATGTNFNATKHLTDAGVGFAAGAAVGMLPLGTPFEIKATVAAGATLGMRKYYYSLGILPDEDPMGDMLEAATAGISGGLNTGSQVADEMISLTLDTGLSIYEKNQLDTPSSRPAVMPKPPASSNTTKPSIQQNPFIPLSCMVGMCAR